MNRGQDHGTTDRYTRGCRCAACKRAAKSAKAAAHRAAIARSAQRVGLLPHGTNDGYSNYDCRCQPCTDAHAEYARQRKAAQP